MDSRLFKPKLIGSVSIDLTALTPGVQSSYIIYFIINRYCLQFI